MADDPRTLEPLVGNCYVPIWTLRPGSYGALREVTAEMPLWLLLFSWDPEYRTGQPCFHTREQIGATLGFGRDKVTRQLRALREAHLVFEMDRGIEPKTQRRRAKARWALDPFASELWRPVVEERLRSIAEEDGQDGRWYQRAVTALDAFDRRNRGMRNRIGEDMSIAPDQQRKRKRKAPPKEARAQNTPRGAKCAGRGVSLPLEVVAKPHPNGPREKKPSGGGPRASHPAPDGEDAPKIGRRSTVDDTRDTP